MDADTYSFGRVEAEAELDQVAALEAASFTNPWTRDMLARELRSSDVARVYVLRVSGGLIAAFCACWIIHDELHINTLAVEAAERRRGLATRLMRFVLAEAAGEGARRATLEVRRSNEPALKLYERLGFRVTAVRPQYYVKPVEDGLVLWCDDIGVSRPAPLP
jgi:ribosomal-protein-alanine N-acetyltransferase